MITAQQITKALGGNWRGNYGIARCPVHDDRHPSLSIRDGDIAPLFVCFAGCDQKLLADEMRRRGLIGNGINGHDGLGGHGGNNSGGDRFGYRSKRVRPKPPREPEPDSRALSFWHEAIEPPGTPLEIYLRETRSIRLPYPPSIRFHPGECAMVAALSRPTDRKIVAVQLTYLTKGGDKTRKGKPRWTYGAMGSGAVHLALCDELLGLAEGTETALSATEITGVPCWSTLGDKRLYRITLPESVRTVHLFADNDEPGRTAAEKAAKSHTSQGRKVVTRYPPVGRDWNDFARLKLRSADS